jgi:DNA-binding XRE family transcriptional regulator
MRKPKRTALEAWRRRRQMSIKTLAEMAGITEGTIIKMERLYVTKYPPSWKVIDSLAKALRVPSYYLADSARAMVVLSRRDYGEVVNGEFPEPWHRPTQREQILMEQALQEAGLDWDLAPEPEVAPEPEKDLDDEFLLQADPLPEAEPDPVNNTRVVYLSLLAQAIASCYADAQDTTNGLISRALVRLAATLGEAAREFEHEVRQQSH